jgi:hypothetical protein
MHNPSQITKAMQKSTVGPGNWARTMRRLRKQTPSCASANALPKTPRAACSSFKNFFTHSPKDLFCKIHLRPQIRRPRHSLI